jgi:hypothetical protein
MKKKPVQTLRINRETLIRMERAALQQPVGGMPVSPGCTRTSCHQICP